MSEKFSVILKKLRANNGPLILILCICFIRFLDLGKESFWFDEAGVAMAASQPTLDKTLEIAQTHAAAMPLDYVVAWGMV